MKFFQLKFIIFSCNVLVLFVWALRSLTEPDIWWQMRTGGWIAQHKAVPKIDVLSYTYQGEPWFNVKWLSELIYYYLGNFIHPNAINLFAGILFVGILLLMWTQLKNKVTSYAFTFTFLLISFVFSYRMNGRPEMFSYFMVSVFFFLFWKAKTNIHYLWILLPLQLCWANLHEAFGIGILMTWLYCLDQIFLVKIENKKIYYILIIGVVLMTCINPHGISLLSYSLNIYGQLQENNFTSEMVGWKDPMYWNAFTNLFLIIFGVVFIYIIKKWKIQNQKIFDTIPAYQIVLILLFFYLGLKSNRNIIFMVLVSFPILHEALENMIPTWMKSNFKVAIATNMLVYLFIVSGTYYTTFNPSNQFGISIHPEKTPIGAYEFIKDKSKGKKVFTDVLSANYGLWALRPFFQSYIDLRDLDVFPTTFFENCYRLYQDPEVLVKGGIKLWELADSIDHFEYVLLLNNENFQPLHQYLNSEKSKFALQYCDPLASVYGRKTQNNNFKNIFHPYTFYKENIEWINLIFNPWYICTKDRKYDYEAYEEAVGELIGRQK